MTTFVTTSYAVDVSMANTQQACTVYFDGSCPLCRREIAYFRRSSASGALQFIDVSQDDARLGPGLERAQSLARFHVRGASGRLVSGAEAFILLWSFFPRFAWLAHLRRVPGVVALLEMVYRGFLVVRPLLQRLMADRTGVRGKPEDAQSPAPPKALRSREFS
jgi:predicted DCC family thiol-disulfide oxidoreductase YuxK